MTLSSFLARKGATGLPTYRVLLAGKEHWFNNSAEVDNFRQTEQARLGRELVVADESPERAPSNGQTNGHGESIFVQELHEVRAINRGIEKLGEFGLDGACLLDAPRIAGRDPLPRFSLHSGDVQRTLPHLRDLVPEIRRLGEKGMTVTRFKGLGEMEPEELWETTLDPAKRHAPASATRCYLQQGGRYVPHPDGREGRATARFHSETRPGSQGHRLSRGVILWIWPFESCDTH